MRVRSLGRAGAGAAAGRFTDPRLPRRAGCPLSDPRPIATAPSPTLAHPPSPDRQVLACIGEQFEEGDEVCGVTVNIRNGKNRIEMWTKTAANEALQISVGKQLKQLIDMSDNTKIGFSVFVSWDGGVGGWGGGTGGGARRSCRLLEALWGPAGCTRSSPSCISPPPPAHPPFFNPPLSPLSPG
jgi:hypothetical protein